VVLGIRPADLLPAPTGTANTLTDIADPIEFHGNDALVSFKFGGKEIGALVKASFCSKTGGQVTYSFENDRLHLFDKETELSLRTA
jgi:multiple sugar transport system ATP-binding protein